MNKIERLVFFFKRLVKQKTTTTTTRKTGDEEILFHSSFRLSKTNIVYEIDKDQFVDRKNISRQNRRNTANKTKDSKQEKKD